MNQLLSHIEFLLHTHNCVIVPNLGGFVVNTTLYQRDGIASFDAPACELVFNRELTYNDGLLAQSLMRTNGVSFETASQEIATAVKQLKQELKDNKFVDLGELGEFRMNDDFRFVYYPKPFVRPMNYGLSKVSFAPTIQIQHRFVPETQQTSGQKAIVRNLGIAAAVAIIAVLMIIFPFNNSDNNFQNAKMVSDAGLFIKNPGGTSANENTQSTNNISIENVLEKTVAHEEAIIDDANIASITLDANLTEIKKFHVVVGVYQVRKVANKMIELLKSEGFSNLSVIEYSDRIDVCANSFSSREEAEVFLKSLKLQYPNHSDAWILKR